MLEPEYTLHLLKYVRVLYLRIGKLTQADQRHREVAAAVERYTILPPQRFFFEIDDLTALCFRLAKFSFVIEHFRKIIATRQCIWVFGPDQFLVDLYDL